MTRAELIRSIQLARVAIEASKKEALHKSISINEQVEVDKLRSEARHLAKSLHEAYMLGPAGGTCPSCGGSGRI